VCAPHYGQAQLLGETVREAIQALIDLPAGENFRPVREYFGHLGI